MLEFEISNTTFQKYVKQCLKKEPESWGDVRKFADGVWLDVAGFSVSDFHALEKFSGEENRVLRDKYAEVMKDPESQYEVYGAYGVYCGADYLEFIGQQFPKASMFDVMKPLTFAAEVGKYVGAIKSQTLFCYCECGYLSSDILNEVGDLAKEVKRLVPETTAKILGKYIAGSDSPFPDMREELTLWLSRPLKEVGNGRSGRVLDFGEHKK